MKTLSWLLIALLLACSIMAAQPTQQYNKIFLDPFYRPSMTNNNNYTYTLLLNPPDGLTSIKSAIINFDMWMTPTVTFSAWVNGQVCNNPSYTISTTFAAAGRGIASFDCSNRITTSGGYNVTIRASGANTGAVTAWLDVTYMNSPVGQVMVHGTEYAPADAAKLWLQLVDANGTALNDAVCYADIYTPNGGTLIERATMTNFMHDGIYYYNLFAPSTLGVYPSIAICFYVASQTPFNVSNSTVTIGTPSGLLNETLIEDGNYYRVQEAANGSVRRLLVDFNISASECLNISPLLLMGATVYWRGRWPATPNNDVITIHIYNYTSSSWIPLANTIPDGGAVFETITNSLLFSNITESGLSSSTGSVLLRFNDTSLADVANNNFDIDRLYVSCDKLSSTGFQTPRGSSEMHVSAPQDNLLNYSLLETAVWNASTRNLTSYPVAVDLTNYSRISNETAANVWNSDATIHPGLLSQIAGAVWNYVARYIHGELI